MRDIFCFGGITYFLIAIYKRASIEDMFTDIHSNSNQSKSVTRAGFNSFCPNSCFSIFFSIIVQIRISIPQSSETISMSPAVSDIDHVPADTHLQLRC